MEATTELPKASSQQGHITRARLRSQIPDASPRGFDSPKSHVIGIACRLKVLIMRSASESGPIGQWSIPYQRLCPTRTPDTPPPPRHTPSPPCRRRAAAGRRPAAPRPQRRARMRFVASATKSEKVVRATSWRGVKRSRYVEKPYGTQVHRSLAGCIGTAAAPAVHVAESRPAAMSLRARWSEPGRSRLRWPSATTAISRAPIRLACPSALM